MTVIDLLSHRGFLIDYKDGNYYLSDNSASEDWECLNSILRSSKIGYADKDGLISITANEDTIQVELNNLFLPIERGKVGVGSCCVSKSWLYHVAKRKHADKIPVSWLEANIAAYIKALSACGLYTGGCCDGNHPNVQILYIEFCYPYADIHKAMWEFHLNSLFSINWNSRYDTIDLCLDKKTQYDELYRVAEYIYQNRRIFINARLDASRWMRKNALKHMSENAIRERFRDEFAIMINKYSSSK